MLELFGKNVFMCTIWPFLFPLDDKVLSSLAASSMCFSFSNQGLRSGSTGVAVFISGESLYVAWLGDSQVVLCKGGQAAQLMTPHKPDREVCGISHFFFLVNYGQA